LSDVKKKDGKNGELNMEYKLQSKVFVCKKCKISFDIQSDSKIEEQKLCSQCKREKE
jgi:hypothetical protein